MKEGSVRPEANESIQVEGVSFEFLGVYIVIEAFYQQVAVDTVLQEPFGSVEDWPYHIEKLSHFWWIRLGGGSYMQVTYNPPMKHYEAGFNEVFLSRWLFLFEKTMKSHLTPEQTTTWINIARRMGVALSRKNDYLISQLGIPNLTR